MSRPATKSPTQTLVIPEIVNGNWNKKTVRVIVPSICTVCGSTRSDPFAVRNKQYGKLYKAECTKGCAEKYEDILLQSKNGGKKVNSSSSPSSQKIYTSFFKPKLEPWKPDTIVGTAPAKGKIGMQCASKKCKEWFDYVEPNQPNGTFLCRSCRGVI